MVHRFFHIFPICFVLSEASCNALKKPSQPADVGTSAGGCGRLARRWNPAGFGIVAFMDIYGSSVFILLQDPRVS